MSRDTGRRCSRWTESTSATSVDEHIAGVGVAGARWDEAQRHDAAGVGAIADSAWKPPASRATITAVSSSRLYSIRLADREPRRARDPDEGGSTRQYWGASPVAVVEQSPGSAVGARPARSAARPAAAAAPRTGGGGPSRDALARRRRRRSAAACTGRRWCRRRRRRGPTGRTRPAAPSGTAGTRSPRRRGSRRRPRSSQAGRRLERQRHAGGAGRAHLHVVARLERAVAAGKPSPTSLLQASRS